MSAGEEEVRIQVLIDQAESKIGTVEVPADLLRDFLQRLRHAESNASTAQLPSDYLLSKPAAQVLSVFLGVKVSVSEIANISRSLDPRPRVIAGRRCWSPDDMLRVEDCLRRKHGIERGKK